MCWSSFCVCWSMVEATYKRTLLTVSCTSTDHTTRDWLKWRHILTIKLFSPAFFIDLFIFLVVGLLVTVMLWCNLGLPDSTLLIGPYSSMLHFSSRGGVQLYFRANLIKDTSPHILSTICVRLSLGLVCSTFRFVEDCFFFLLLCLLLVMTHSFNFLVSGFILVDIDNDCSCFYFSCFFQLFSVWEIA